MCEQYFLGDIHIGHKNILKYRPEFPSLEEHDARIMDNILSTVGKRDLLWLTGDCFFTKESLDFLRTLRSHIPRINLVLGNHDTDNRERVDNVKTIIREDLVDKVGAIFTVKDFWVTHAPIHSEELRGKRNIHGHVHTNTLEDPRYYNTSCENVGYKPISLSAIRGKV